MNVGLVMHCSSNFIKFPPIFCLDTDILGPANSLWIFSNPVKGGLTLSCPLLLIWSNVRFSIIALQGDQKMFFFFF